MYAILRNSDNSIVSFGLHRPTAEKLVKKMGKNKYTVVLNEIQSSKANG